MFLAFVTLFAIDVGIYTRAFVECARLCQWSCYHIEVPICSPARIATDLDCGNTTQI